MSHPGSANDGLEYLLRKMIREEVRVVLREEISAALTSERPPQKTGPANENRSYLTVAQAAEFTAVDKRTVRRWVQAGKLTEFRAGRLLRICPRELENFIAQSSTTAPTRADIARRAREVLTKGKTRP